MKKRREVTSDPLTPVAQVNKREKHIEINLGSSCVVFRQDASLGSDRNDSYQCLAGDN